MQALNLMVTLMTGMVMTAVSYAQVIADAGSDNLQVYPSPTDGTLNFIFTRPHFNNAIMRLYGPNGQLVKEVLIVDPQYSIDLKGLKPGVYLFHWIMSDELAGSGKIVLR